MDHVGTVSYDHIVNWADTPNKTYPILLQINRTYGAPNIDFYADHLAQLKYYDSSVVAVWYPKGLKQRNHETKTEAQ